MSLNLMLDGHTLATITASASAAPRAQLDVLMLTGFLLAVVQVACYAYRRRSGAMAVGLLLTSISLAVFAVVAGAWPLALMQIGVAGTAAFRMTRVYRSRFRARRRGVFQASQSSAGANAGSSSFALKESRLSRLFGPPGSIN